MLSYDDNNVAGSLLCMELYDLIANDYFVFLLLLVEMLFRLLINSKTRGCLLDTYYKVRSNPTFYLFVFKGYLFTYLMSMNGLSTCMPAQQKRASHPIIASPARPRALKVAKGVGS